MRVDEFKRLMAIDAALWSRDGLHLGEMAKRFGCSQKTIRREMDILRMHLPIVCRQVGADNGARHSHRHWYTDRRRRVFSRSLGSK